MAVRGASPYLCIRRPAVRMRARDAEAIRESNFKLQYWK